MESKKLLAQNAYKSFSKMVEYCEIVKCRHSILSDYFGDSSPDCRKHCDVCLNKDKVEALLARYKNLATQRYTMQSKLEANNECDLYEGGRLPKKSFDDVIYLSHI